MADEAGAAAVHAADGLRRPPARTAAGPPAGNRPLRPRRDRGRRGSRHRLSAGRAPAGGIPIGARRGRRHTRADQGPRSAPRLGRRIQLPHSRRAAHARGAARTRRLVAITGRLAGTSPPRRQVAVGSGSDRSRGCPSRSGSASAMPRQSTIQDTFGPGVEACSRSATTTWSVDGSRICRRSPSTSRRSSTPSASSGPWTSPTARCPWPSSVTSRGRRANASVWSSPSTAPSPP